MFKSTNAKILKNTKNKIFNLFDKLQNLSNEELDFELNELNKYIIQNYDSLPKKSKILDNISKKLNIIKIKCNYKNKIFSKEHPILNFILNKVNAKISELEDASEGEKICKIYPLITFAAKEISDEEEKKEPNYGKLKVLKHIIGIIHLITGNIEKSNKMFKHSTDDNFMYKIQQFFNKEKLKNFLENSNTTKKDIEEKILSIRNKFKNHSSYEVGASFDFHAKFAKEQMNNFYKIKREYELILKNFNEKLKNNEELSEEEKYKIEESYNIYANILYLDGLTWSNMKNNENEFGTARESFDIENSCREISFYLNEGKILSFICENCFDPRTLQEKIENLLYFRKDLISKENLYNIIDKNLSNIESRLLENLEPESKKILAGLNFFRANIIEKLIDNIDANYNQKYFDCLEKAERYYSEIDSNESKVAYLAVINNLQNTFNNSNSNKDNNENNNDNIFVKMFKGLLNIGNNNNQLEPVEKENADRFYESLSELNKNDKVLYAKAQYECGLYMEEKDKNKAAIHFNNASEEGYDRAKIKVIENLVEENEEDNREKINALESGLSEKYSETVAKIYKKNENYEKSIEFYKKAVNYTNSIYRSKNIFTKIGDCCTKIGDKIKKAFFNSEDDNEKKLEYYNEAKEYYKKAILVNGYYFDPDYKIGLKIILACKKSNDIDAYKYYINYQKYIIFDKLINSGQLTEKEDSEKEYIKKILYEIALFYKEKAINSSEYEKPNDTREFLKYFNEAAKLGDKESMYELGMYYYFTNKEAAREYFINAIKLNHQKAIIEYIDLLYKEEESLKIGNEIFDLANKIKNLDDKYEIANKIRRKYPQKAFKLYINMANNDGNMAAKYNAALMLLVGKGIKKNETKAIKYFEELSKNDIDQDIKIRSLKVLGNIFYGRSENIEDKENNINKAIEYYNEFLLSIEEKSEYNEEKEEIVVSLNKLIEEMEMLKYNKAKNISKTDREQAIKLFKELTKYDYSEKIRKESIKSIVNNYRILWKNNKENKEYLKSIIKYCLKFKEFNLDLDESNAVDNIIKFSKTYKKFLENKNDKTVKFRLAKMYSDGIGIKKDETLAIKYFTELSQTNDNDVISIDSLLALGDIYAEHYKEQDLNIAENYYNSVLNKFRENTSKLEEIKARMIGLCARKDVLMFNEKTKNKNIEDTVKNMLEYLKIININQEEKKKKFKYFIKNVNAKISKFKKKLLIGKIEKINEELDIDNIEITINNNIQ